MTTARNDRRPDRRPEWLRRKHGHVWPKPRTKLDLWADKVVQILNDYQTGQRTTPWPDQASADAARKALNRAARSHAGRSLVITPITDSKTTGAPTRTRALPPR